MQWNEETGEWELNPAKFKEKYDIDPVVEEKMFEEAVERDIDALQEIEAEEAAEITVNDIVSIDPETGKLKIDEAAYYEMFGVYPSFELEDEGEAVTARDDVAEKDPISGDQWRMDRRGADFMADFPDYQYPKDSDKYWAEYGRRYPFGRYPYPPAAMDNDWRMAERQQIPAVAA